MRVGILGGTFDPIHRGHLGIAEEAWAQAQLDEVWFIPTGNPWMKNAKAVSAGAHRLAMVDIAIAGRPFFRSSSIELDRSGNTYTLDTLRELGKRVRPNTAFFLILGMDALLTFPRWHCPGEILSLSRLLVAGRPGFSKGDLKEESELPEGGIEGIVWIRMPKVDISGSGIRSRVRAGQAISGLVEPGVEEYISARGLYREEEGA